MYNSQVPARPVENRTMESDDRTDNVNSNNTRRPRVASQLEVYHVADVAHRRWERSWSSGDGAFTDPFAFGHFTDNVFNIVFAGAILFFMYVHQAKVEAGRYAKISLMAYSHLPSSQTIRLLAIISPHPGAQP